MPRSDRPAIDDRALSKFLSYVLRHAPEHLGLHLDPQGFVALSELLIALQRVHSGVGAERLDRLIQQDPKQRYGYDPSGLRVRAQQGHSLQVELGLPAVAPPDTLYHGTALRFLPLILAQGLSRGARHHVHLSADRGSALTVGSRRGKAVLLAIQAGELAASGALFYRTANNVWLTEQVPPGFIAVLAE